MLPPLLRRWAPVQIHISNFRLQNCSLPSCGDGPRVCSRNGKTDSKCAGKIETARGVGTSGLGNPGDSRGRRPATSASCRGAVTVDRNLQPRGRCADCHPKAAGIGPAKPHPLYSFISLRTPAPTASRPASRSRPPHRHATRRQNTRSYRRHQRIPAPSAPSNAQAGPTIRKGKNM